MVPCLDMLPHRNIVLPFPQEGNILELSFCWGAQKVLHTGSEHCLESWERCLPFLPACRVEKEQLTKGKDEEELTEGLLSRIILGTNTDGSEESRKVFSYSYPGSLENIPMSIRIYASSGDKSLKKTRRNKKKARWETRYQLPKKIDEFLSPSRAIWEHLSAVQVTLCSMHSRQNLLWWNSVKLIKQPRDQTGMSREEPFRSRSERMFLTDSQTQHFPALPVRARKPGGPNLKDRWHQQGWDDPFC